MTDLFPCIRVTQDAESRYFFNPVVIRQGIDVVAGGVHQDRLFAEVELEAILRRLFVRGLDAVVVGSVRTDVEGGMALIDRRPRRGLEPAKDYTHIYCASRVRHAPMWRELRAQGVPIHATWIDEAGEGQTKDYGDLWVRCIREASSSRALILYAPAGDPLKGALVEAGAALASGVPVYVVGTVGSFRHHPLVREVESVAEALRQIGIQVPQFCPAEPPQAVLPPPLEGPS